MNVKYYSRPTTIIIPRIDSSVSGYHRKHAVRLLWRDSHLLHPSQQRLGRRIYSEPVGEALIITWEATDRICGKRLKAILPNLVDAMERHGHIHLDLELQRSLLAASAAVGASKLLHRRPPVCLMPLSAQCGHKVVAPME